MAANALEIEVTAKNAGDQPEPMGIGWHPRFALPGGGRQGIELKLPDLAVLAMNDRLRGQPSGKVEAPGSLVGKYQQRPTALGGETLDAALVNAKLGNLPAGSTAEILDTTRGLGLRLTALSGNMRELHVVSPGGAPYVSLGLQTNYDDPFGRQWAVDEGIMTLLPGASVTWKIRLEIFALPERVAAGH